MLDISQHWNVSRQSLWVTGIGVEWGKRYGLVCLYLSRVEPLILCVWWGVQPKSAVRAILSEMRRAKDSAAALAKSLASLSAFADCKERRAVAGAEGATGEIVAAMTSHRESKEVQSAGCKALAALCSKINANRIRIAAEGGIEAVIGGMRGHGASAGVQEKGCAALVQLVRLTANAARFAPADGQSTVSAAMQRFPDSTSIQAQGKLVLRRQRVRGRPK